MLSVKEKLKKVNKLYPYIQLCRLDKPIGIWLLFFPSLWSLIQAFQGKPPLQMIFFFFLGALVMRGAGCTYNDLIDKEYDAYVERTRSRPLVQGKISKKATL